MISITFISGPSRCGSTYLDYKLGLMENAFSLGELRQLVKRSIKLNEKCGCNVYFSECDTWNAILKNFSQNNDLERLMELDAKMRSSVHYFLPFLFTKERSEYRQLMKGLIYSIHEVTGANHIIDSSKTGYFASLVYDDPDYDVNYIMLYRNPLGTISSMGKTRERFEHNPNNEDSLKTMRKTGVLASALLWNLRSFESMLHSFSFQKKFLIQYEDMGSPEMEIFFQRNYPPKKTNTAVHHSLSGNPSRFSKSFLVFQPDLGYKKKSPLWKLTTHVLVSPINILLKIYALSASNPQHALKEEMEQSSQVFVKS